MFRETDPQYFATQGGLFLIEECSPIITIVLTFVEGSIREVVKMIEDLGLTEQVTIIKLNLLLPGTGVPITTARCVGCIGADILFY